MTETWSIEEIRRRALKAVKQVNAYIDGAYGVPLFEFDLTVPWQKAVYDRAHEMMAEDAEEYSQGSEESEWEVLKASLAPGSPIRTLGGEPKSFDQYVVDAFMACLQWVIIDEYIRPIPVRRYISFAQALEAKYPESFKRIDIERWCREDGVPMPWFYRQSLVDAPELHWTMQTQYEACYVMYEVPIRDAWSNDPTKYAWTLTRKLNMNDFKTLTDWDHGTHALTAEETLAKVKSTKHGYWGQPFIDIRKALVQDDDMFLIERLIEAYGEYAPLVALKLMFVTEAHVRKRPTANREKRSVGDRLSDYERRLRNTGYPSDMVYIHSQKIEDENNANTSWYKEMAYRIERMYFVPKPDFTWPPHDTA